jgi:hypothetical protein
VSVGKRVLLITALLLGTMYLCDYLSVRYRIPNHRHPFGTITIHPYYAVPRKDGKTEFLFDERRTEQCVHSLFPHFGDNPCWYVSRRTQRRIDL